MSKAFQSNPSSSKNLALCRAIAQRIQSAPNKRIPFAEFMDIALYDLEYGYYASHQQQIGVRGDFMTSPHLGSDFGELLAEQFAEMWLILEKPDPFQLVEMGAGQGLIVRDVLSYLHHNHFDCFNAIEYLIIERSPALVQEQKRQMTSLPTAQSRIRWCEWGDIQPQSITGCFFSNELVDAFPVHQLIFQNGMWEEIYVTVDTDERFVDTSHIDEESFKVPHFIEVTDAVSDPILEGYFPWVGVDFKPSLYPNGYRTEVNLVALDWIKTVSTCLNRGYVLTIDYGYCASRYYSPSRSHGTLQCYYQHAHHSDPYRYIGQQDITAHVDFTALQKRGEEVGLSTLEFIEQGLFLMALGLGDRLSALSNPTTVQSISGSDLLRRREALHALMNPLGLGNFRVLLQGKGLHNYNIETPLKGFNLPPL